MSVTTKYYPIKCTPTVFPDGAFNAEIDALKLHKALDNDTVDESQIIEVLGKRTFVQRMKIADAYHNDRNVLFNCLKSKLSDKFRFTVLGLMAGTAGFHAGVLRNTDCAQLNINLLIMLLATHSNYAIKLFNLTYEKMYGFKISDNLNISDFDLRDFITLLLQGCRVESEINEECIETDIVVLNAYHTVDKNKWKKFVLHILGTRSYQQLIEMDKLEPLNKLITEFTMETQYIYCRFIKYVTNKNYCFAVDIYNSFPVDNDSIISSKNHLDIVCIIVGRCEIDLGDIKRVFEATYGCKMEQYVKRIPEVTYRDLLNTLIS